MKRRNNIHAGRLGFTLIELLIAVIIIAILVSMIVVVYSNRAAQARITAAQSDVDAIQNAEQHIAIDTGYFFRFYALDDVIGGDGVSPDQWNPATPPTDVTDGIRDEALRTVNTNALDLFVDVKTGDLLPQGDTVIFPRLALSETAFNFNGPYLNYTRKYGAKIPPANNTMVVGLPLDPWSQPYLFFTAKGLIDEANGVMEGPTTTRFGGSHNTLVFDRPTVLCLGPNNLPGDGGPTSNFGEGDDIFKQF
jgi:prepilin-type N-terminal cleavage/methylation domain-containing protein